MPEHDTGSQPSGLSRQAYEPVPEGARYEPYVSAGESPLEFTLKAVIPGIIFGVIFGAANAYLGLQAGLTISTSIPIAVMTVAAFRAFRALGMKGSILEANLSQTIGSSSSSVASGVIFTLPALFMWGFDPELLQMTLLAMCGGLIGVLFMIPLRAFLIDREHGHLPYPEGTACAEVLVASEIGGARAKNVFLALAAGALNKFLFGWLRFAPDTIKLPVPVLPKAQLGMKLSAALFGVGFILGPRIGAIMVGGGLLSSLVIIPVLAIWGAGMDEPFYPETVKTIAQMSHHEIWNRYVRYIGAGAVAAAGLITLIRSTPTMIESFKIGAKQLGDRLGTDAADLPRTSQDVPLKYVGLGIAAIIAVMTLVPQVFGTVDSTAMRFAASVCIAIFAFFFVTVASRIVGLVGVTSNPTSGMTIASLLGTATVFRLLGWVDDSGLVATLTVGCVVAIAASISGDTSQDLKTGFLLGATPRRQQIGELIGVLTSATAVCATVILLDQSLGLGSTELPAPQGTLMKLVIEGVLQAKLPWILVGVGAGITIVMELLRVPSLPFAVGVYLPVSTMVPVFFGGMLRWIVERRARDGEDRAARRERGVLFGSGLVGGEGLLGVAVAGVTLWQNYPPDPSKANLPLPLEVGYSWGSEPVTMLAGAAVMIALAGFFYWRCRAGA